jgi:hypothetical protein
MVSCPEPELHGQRVVPLIAGDGLPMFLHGQSVLTVGVQDLRHLRRRLHGDLVPG